MNPSELERLSALPRLDGANQRVLPCKVCGGHASIFDLVDLNKFCSVENFYGYGLSGVTVHYYKCSQCGLIFTEFFDQWNTEDFSRFIYNDDYAKVDGDYASARPERDAVVVAQRLAGLTHLRLLDYGSGSRVLSRSLRSRGFEGATNYDPVSSPARPCGAFDVVTCFEVLEHTTRPLATLADIASFLAPGGCVLFTTGIQPPDIAALRANWWYIAPRNGHVTIYTLNALALGGRAAGLTLYAGPGGTAFADSTPTETSGRLLASVGTPSQFLRLTAPGRGWSGTGPQRDTWHDVEGAEPTAFRWTRLAQVQWRLAAEGLYSCDLTITIPFHIEVEPGFADRCRLDVGGQSVPVSRQGNELKASLTLHQPANAIVTLHTPPPIRPADLRDSLDQRPLGLAITAGPGVDQA